MDYKIIFHKTDSEACYSFIGKGTLNAALSHTKERMKKEHFLKAEVWEQQGADSKGTLRHTFTADKADFIDLLITPDPEELVTGYTKQRQYEVMYPATDSELLEAIERYGGFGSTQYERIGHNVVIADEAIAVALKPQPIGVNTLYVIDGRELPLPDDKRSGIAAKVWATPAVMEDIRIAEERLLAQLHNNK